MIVNVLAQARFYAFYVCDNDQIGYRRRINASARKITLRFQRSGVIKWLEHVISRNTERLVTLAIALFLLGSVVESSLLGAAFPRVLDRMAGLPQRHTEIVVRIIAAGAFVSRREMGNASPTPELATEIRFVP